MTGLVMKTGPSANRPVLDSKEGNSGDQAESFNDILGRRFEDKSVKNDARKRDMKLVAADAKKSKPVLQTTDRQLVARSGVEKSDFQSNSQSRATSDFDPSKMRADRTGQVEYETDGLGHLEDPTEDPPDPQMMDPRASALKAKRDQVIRQFMDSFEGEFGIPPEDLVVAMSQLTEQDLEQPPEKTADRLLSNLQLSSQDELKAKKMYLGLLMQLKQLDAAAALPLSPDNLLSQLQAQRVQVASDKKNVMANQVQNLNDKFWMRGSFGQNPEAPGLPIASESQDLFRKILRPVEPESVPLDFEEFEGIKSTEALMKEIQEGQSDKSSSDSFDEATEMSSQTQKSDQPFVSEETVAAEFKRMGFQTPKEGMKKSLQSKVDPSAPIDGAVLSTIRPETISSQRPAAENRPPVEMSPTQKQENIQQLMSQAQFLVTKGGGEVKVEMSPEGMGSIQLKLQVLDGKVHVQMNTETKEAKKLIESSVNDLKQSLAAHQLAMDSVKVEVVNAPQASANAQNEQQSQMQNFLNQQQRDGTRQFWQQFNENFGNRQARDQFFDAQNIRSPARNQVLPGFDSSGSTNKQDRRDGRGHSLNLVA